MKVLNQRAFLIDYNTDDVPTLNIFYGKAATQPMHLFVSYINVWVKHRIKVLEASSTKY